MSYGTAHMANITNSTTLQSLKYSVAIREWLTTIGNTWILENKRR